MKKITSHLALLILVISCDNSLNHTHEAGWNIDWTNLRDGIVEMDADIVLPEINKLLAHLEPDQTPLDPSGQRANIDWLVEHLNLVPDSISAELVCFARILTGPPQTEMSLRTDSSGTDVTRIIDIRTPSDSNLEAVRMHR